jgi:hypothetical protein
VIPYTNWVTTPKEKGNALEATVAAIEQHILGTSPALREKTFLIESKKIFTTVAGVHHEIDIFVTIDVGGGYESVFIFECKNWEDAVGKNEIIIFAEKIDATRAQDGYFVAKSFTKDACSQAATNQRIRLVEASEHEPTTAPLPFGFHSLIMTPVHAEATFHKRDGGTQLKTIDVATAVAKLRGELIDLRGYLCKWAEDAASQDALSFRSERYPEGDYERSTEAKREFAERELTIDGMEIAWAETSVRYKATVVRPAVVSYFEVQSRGRVVSLAPMQIPSAGTIEMKLIYR